MATINPTMARAGDDVIIFTWETLTAANAVGAPIPPRWAEFADRTVQVLGTFDSATLVWQGSNNGVDYLTLTDPQGNNISKTAAALETVTDNAAYQRPSTSGGGAGQDLDVIIVCRRQPKR